MTNQPKTRPIPNDRTISSLFPARFLKPQQLIDWKITDFVGTITRIIEEEVQPKPGQTEWKPVVYFQSKKGGEFPQGYLVSAKADADALQSATQVEFIADLPGKQIRIHLAEYRGKSVLRIDPNPVQPPAIAETRKELESEEEPEEEQPDAFVTEPGEIDF